MTLANLVALDDFGGLQTLYLSLAAHLAKNGIPVVTINRASAEPLDVFRHAIAQSAIKIHSPQCHPLVRFTSRSRLTSKVLGRLVLKSRIRRVFRDEGVRRLVSWNGIPMKAWLPPNGDMILYDHGLSSIHKPTLAKRERLRIASEIVAISEANAHLLRERWGWRRKITVLPNPLRTLIADAPAVQRTSYAQPGKFIVGAASRLVSFKGMASLVHAAAIASSRGVPVELRIAGEGPELENLKNCAAELHATDFVKFLGLVEDMPGFFAGLDAFVAPSLREPFGLAPLEALASGVPTILSNVDGHPEILPFPSAATLVTPTLRLDEYQALGASLNKMPQVVFSPERRTLMTPMALDPCFLADALALVYENFPEHCAIASQAAIEIRNMNSMSRYADRFLSICGGFGSREEAVGNSQASPAVAT